MGSMHMGLEADSDGGRALAAFYAERARGGAALIVTGGSAISRVGAGARRYSFINEPSSEEMFARVTGAVHEAGGSIALQLFHAGRYAFASSFGLQPVAPSTVPSRFSPDQPRALSDAEVRATVDDFAKGALRARALGFDAVEVMASEGYLINQFLSPLTNRRDDEWGGDFERRAHFARAVLAAIRSTVDPAFPVIVRMSGADLMEGSTTPEETLRFAEMLAAGGADALNVGIGWHESPTPTVQQMVPEGAWIEYARAVKRAVGALPVIASNRVSTIDLADALLAEGGVDFISMARPFLADPRIVEKARSGNGVALNRCIACNQACLDRSFVDARVSCMVNPRAGRELDFPMTLRRGAGTFAILGGGPAGLEAARALAVLGARVEVFEAAEELGGQFRLARTIPGKRVYDETIRYYARELERLGVRVHLRRRLEAPDVDALRGLDGVVVATGVTPRHVAIAGSELPHVVPYDRALLEGNVFGKRVAVIGAGGIGVDVAHRCSSEGREVTLMRRGSVIGEHIGRTTRWVVMRALRDAGVRFYANVTYDAIVPEGVRIVTAQGEALTIEAETVVIAAGQERNDAIVESVATLGIRYCVVGGARDAAELDAVRAFDEGLRAAHELTTAASPV